MQGVGWAFKNYVNHNLSKLVIEPENCRPPHVFLEFLVGGNAAIRVTSSAVSVLFVFFYLMIWEDLKLSIAKEGHTKKMTM